ncbi:hypothetical protein BZA77DRAFT_137271 [Pyronema omphalodes]|nr:hypothetical protein BZA77DRAFT_137271 [Pyronema omphalodes]
MSINPSRMASTQASLPTLSTRPSPPVSDPAAYSPFPVPRTTSRALGCSTPSPPPHPLPPIPKKQKSFYGRSGSVSSPHKTTRRLLGGPLHATETHQLREQASEPLLGSDNYLDKIIRSHNGSTRVAPTSCNISNITNGGYVGEKAANPDASIDHERYGRVPTPIGCLPGRGFRVEDLASLGERRRTEEGTERAPGRVKRRSSIFGEVGLKMKNVLRGLHTNVSTGLERRQEFVEDYAPRPQLKRQITLRIKNNESGSCVFEIMKHDNTDEEILTPINDLKRLFPHSKQLQKTLNEWNRHYQNPPQHWIVNFIPRAYLKRGYTLSEDVFEYFKEHEDGCEYRIEYEPIGHHFSHVGTTVPTSMRSGRRASGPW